MQAFFSYLHSQLDLSLLLDHLQTESGFSCVLRRASHILFSKGCLDHESIFYFAGTFLHSDLLRLHQQGLFLCLQISIATILVASLIRETRFATKVWILVCLLAIYFSTDSLSVQKMDVPKISCSSALITLSTFIARTATS